ncbi:MAG: hypothetical protein CL878_13935 [Dehalococcoidia bacterium]|nr:hypothetical protein [Dehalococcoidia bacterium]
MMSGGMAGPRGRIVLVVFALPVALGLLAAVVGMATATRLAEPISLVWLGLLVGLLLASGAHGEARASGTARWRKAVWGAGAIAAVLLAAWVAVNRLFGLSTGALRPSTLLLAGVACGALSLGAALWGRRSVALARRGDVWLRTHADAVCVSASVAVALGFRASIMFRAPAFVIGDSGAYMEAAETIRSAFSFAPLGDIFPPGYSTFIAGVQILLGPDFLAVVAIQHLLGLGSVILTYAVGRACFPPLLALLPALGTAANGFLLIIEHGIYTEALFIPLALLFTLFTVRMLQDGGWWIVAATGATLGLAALTRLVIQPALMAVSLLLLVYDGFRYRTWLRVLVFVAVFGAVVSPWLAHSWVRYRYVGLSNSLGQQLLVRLWEEEGSYTWADTDEQDPEMRRVLALLQAELDRDSSHWEAWQRVEAEFGAGTTPALMTAAALNVISRHPARYLDRSWFRLQRMWRGGFAQERVHDLYAQQGVLNVRSPIFSVGDGFASVAELAGNRTDWITRLFRPNMLPAFLTLALTVACAVSVIVSERLRPALVPLGMGMGLLVIPVLLNADRARFHHSAEPFLLLTYAAGLWGIVLAIRSGWRRVRLTSQSPFRMEREGEAARGTRPQE